MSKHKGTIVVTGRGGTGKTTFTTLLSRYLGEKNVEPILLVDSDPDESLADMLGIDLKKHGKRSIASVLSEIIEERKMARMRGMTPTDKIEPFLFQESLYEGRDFFDFIGIGTKWIEGCYCLPDRSLSQIMDLWGENYEYVIVDSPAGVEHLNRRITKEIKDVFNVLDPSKKSFDNAARSHKIMKEVDIEFENYYLVGGYRFPEKMVDEAKKQPFPFLGRIEPDPLILDYNIEGRSLFKLPEESPTYQSIKKIMKKAGY
ncbi:AAA family ATPase [Candidatus Bathyarchaeota archaeon]|nr:AAA family ATPase [Candidatus Bathyarchaeota archaeon]